MEEVGHLGPVVADSALLKKAKRKRKEIFRRFGCNEWKNYLPQVIQIPVWLTAIEALREMCGKQEGLLRMVTKLFTSSYPLATPSIVERSLSVEQSFATEGALWFPNLMVADPQMILPFMLSGAILLNLTKATGTTVWQKRLKRSLGVVALVLGPLTLQFPSALLIYWISSSMLAYVQDALLSRYMPVKPPVVPCKPRRPRMLSVEKIKVDLR
jgi:inner membrane protein COX18